MNLEYETDRLILRVCNEEYADELLSFVTDNREFFRPWDPLRTASFFTKDFQAEVLRAEFQAFLRGIYLRYYLFEKTAPDIIAGTVSFSHITRGEDRSCRIGYRLAQNVTGRGYATEAVAFLLERLRTDYKMHRIEADIMKENSASLRLIERLGFTREGTARSSHKINGVWTDHLRYACILEE